MEQVTLTLVIVLDDTCDTKGRHGPVCVSQTGTCSEKCPSSIRLCFCQSGIQPNIEVIFWGTGNRIKDIEKKS